MSVRPRNSDLPEKKKSDGFTINSGSGIRSVQYSHPRRNVTSKATSGYWNATQQTKLYTRRQPRSYIAIAKNAVAQASSKHDHIGYHFFR